MDKNTDYFIEHLPYFDKLDLAALAQAQARAAAVYGGQVDAVMQITKEDMERAWNDPAKYHSQVGNFFNGHIFAFNANRPPFDDVRVRRAVHLVVDKMTLHELTSKTSFNGEEPGGWFLPDWQTGGSPYSRSGEDLAMVPGFRIPTAEDLAEAKRLLAEAGYPDGAGLNVSFLQRGNQPSAAVAAIQDMIRKNLNVEMEIELTDEGGYYDRVLNKDFDTTGTFTAAEIIDPGPWFTRFLADGGSWNYGGWSDPKTDVLMKQINEEQDVDKRVELVREMQVLLDEIVPIMLYNYQGGYDIYRTYLGGPGMTDIYYGGYNSMHRRWTHIWFERDRE
jgi:oligopeptide transport system substrate-binding protein